MFMVGAFTEIQCEGYCSVFGKLYVGERIRFVLASGCDVRVTARLRALFR